jgi:hypothetical protein
MKEKVCFGTDTLLLSSVLLIIAVGALIYIVYNHIQSIRNKVVVQKVIVEKPVPMQSSQSRWQADTLQRPLNTGGSNFFKPDLQGKRVGYIYNNSTRLPLFENKNGRDNIYFTIDDSRNGIKIDLFKKQRDTVTDGETFNNPELGGMLNVKLYDTSLIYNGNNY